MPICQKASDIAEVGLIVICFVKGMFEKISHYGIRFNYCSVASHWVPWMY